jgi:hypothetical protein
MRDIEAGLASQGVSEALRREVWACLEQCDLLRFAPEEDDPETRARFLERVSGMMTELNREIGR